MKINYAARRAVEGAFQFLAIGITALVVHGAVSSYRILAKIPVPGSGGWDYVTVDDVGRRAYVSHSNQVEVLDIDTRQLVGSIPGTPGVHGVAIAREFGRGFITAGDADSVVVFDLASLKRIAELKTGKGPDAVVYDPATKRVFAMNGDANTASVFNASDGSSVGTINLGGGPEFSVADGNGNVYVDLEAEGQLLRINSRTLQILDRWSVAPCQRPSSLALDAPDRRLFLGCRSDLMAVVDADSGKVIATAPIGDHVDATAFDPATKLIFHSTGDGNVTVFHQDSPDRYTFLQKIATNRGSKTMALDLRSHDLFVPASESGNFEIIVLGAE